MSRPPRLTPDSLNPGDTFQAILKKSGKPVSGLYSDDRGEVRSPELGQQKREDADSRKNR